MDFSTRFLPQIRLPGDSGRLSAPNQGAHKALVHWQIQLRLQNISNGKFPNILIINGLCTIPVFSYNPGHPFSIKNV